MVGRQKIFSDLWWAAMLLMLRTADLVYTTVLLWYKLKKCTIDEYEVNLVFSKKEVSFIALAPYLFERRWFLRFSRMKKKVISYLKTHFPPTAASRMSVTLLLLCRSHHHHHLCLKNSDKIKEEKTNVLGIVHKWRHTAFYIDRY